MWVPGCDQSKGPTRVMTRDAISGQSWRDSLRYLRISVTSDWVTLGLYRNKLTATGGSDTQSPAGGEGGFGLGSVLALPSSLSSNRLSVESSASSAADREAIARDIKLNPSIVLIDVKKEMSSSKKKSRRKVAPKRCAVKREKPLESDEILTLSSNSDTLTEKMEECHSDSSDSRMSLRSSASDILGKRPPSRRLSSEAEDELTLDESSRTGPSQNNNRRKKKRSAVSPPATVWPTSEESHAWAIAGMEERKRGRPPTTGDYAGLAAAKREVREEREREAQLKLEEGIIEEWMQRCKDKMQVLSKTPSDTDFSPDEGKDVTGPIEGANAALLVRMVEKEATAIRRVATTSKNLKESYIKLLKDASSTIQVVAETLSRRSLKDETKSMAAENKRLQQEVESLRKELQEVKDEMRELATMSTRHCPSPPAPETELELQMPEVEMSEPATLRDTGEVRRNAPRKCKLQEDNKPWETAQETAQDTSKSSFEELARTIMTQVGMMITARFEALESRLLPERPLRPPLASRKSADPKLGSGPLTAGEKRDRRKEKPTIIENVRLKQHMVVARREDETPLLPPGNMSEAATWTKVVKSKSKKKRKTATIASADTGKGSEVPQPQPRSAELKKPREQPRRAKNEGKRTPNERASSQPRRRRAPRTAAVAIRGTDPKCSYAEILSEARRKVSLTSLGIESSKVRKAASGGMIIEIPGAGGAQKADVLAGRLREAFSERKEGEEVVVSRPTIKGELRVIGLDDTTDSVEVQKVIAEKGAGDSGT
ncbi:calponin homology domain-containing protein DDB_G0272472-like [Linepithema humile]|uniref:calponin homology domain-containing protein DDB_G0272472-like n=1 Tax=Linepithema humile TaxID=83485 RepID=UPI00351E6F2C